jgi:bifunctional DNA-binding transcriptional regulator/antitoxin component of YhaV-PrlF toxin-antitoxin module
MKTFEIATITTTHHFTIPAPLWRSLGWQPGEKLVVTVEDEQRGVFSLRKATPRELVRLTAPSRRRQEATSG